MNPSRSGYLIIGGLVSIAGLAVIAALLNGRTREPLPIIADVPSFELVDTSGEPFSDEDLKGSPYVVDLIFTHCAAICPRMLRRPAGSVPRRNCRRGPWPSLGREP